MVVITKRGETVVVVSDSEHQKIKRIQRTFRFLILFWLVVAFGLPALLGLVFIDGLENFVYFQIVVLPLSVFLLSRFRLFPESLDTEQNQILRRNGWYEKRPYGINKIVSSG